MPATPKFRIPRVKKALRIGELLDIYEVWGGPATRAAVSLWMKRGRFPHARKRSQGRNSPWIIPISDVVSDVKLQWPNGPITDKIGDVPQSLRPTLRHICLTAYDIDIDSLSPDGRATLFPRQLTA